MFKTILITFFLLLANSAEAHPNCENTTTWQAGYYTHHGQWIPGQWTYDPNCRVSQDYYYPPRRPWFGIRINTGNHRYHTRRYTYPRHSSHSWHARHSSHRHQSAHRGHSSHSSHRSHRSNSSSSQRRNHPRR